MNRIFRLWNKQSNKWQTRVHERTSIFFYGWERIIAERIFSDELFVKNDYIGFTDRGKTIIFEDDIVRLRIKDGKRTIYVIGVIKLFAPDYALVSPQGIFPISKEDSDDLEILGNIREDNLFTVTKNPMRLKTENFKSECECLGV